MIAATTETKVERFDGPFHFKSGAVLPEYELAYEWYGELNADRSNCILLQHGATSGAHAAGLKNPDDPKSAGWWDKGIGPGCLLDTNRYAILSVNAIGSCFGSTGPTSIEPRTGSPYSGSFPVVTAEDVVRSQVPLLDRLGISKLYATIGGSMGGMCATTWAVLYPERVENVISFGAGYKTPAITIGFNEALRHAIYADPKWRDGHYPLGDPPVAGLRAARMLAVMTWMSADAFAARFGRRLQDREAPTWSLDADFQIESFLRYYGSSSTTDIDANTYARMMRLLDYYDLSEGRGRGALVERLRGLSTRFLLVAFSTDMRCPPDEVARFASVLWDAGIWLDYVNHETPLGHSSFVMEPDALKEYVHRFLG